MRCKIRNREINMRRLRQSLRGRQTHELFRYNSFLFFGYQPIEDMFIIILAVYD